jgi:hypothetical protein
VDPNSHTSRGEGDSIDDDEGINMILANHGAQDVTPHIHCLAVPTGTAAPYADKVLSWDTMASILVTRNAFVIKESKIKQYTNSVECRKAITHNGTSPLFHDISMSLIEDGATPNIMSIGRGDDVNRYFNASE